jgi:hypothetical protein
MRSLKFNLFGFQLNHPQATSWLVISGILRLIVCLAIHGYSLETGYQGFVPFSYGDDQLYWELSNTILDTSTLDYLPNPYPLILAGLFQITGRSLLAGKLLNVIVSSLTVYFGVLVSHEISMYCKFTVFERRRACNFSGILLTLFPSMLFLSGQLVKDPLTVFFGICSVYLSLLVFFQKKYIFSLPLIVALGALFAFRPYAGISVVFGLLAYLGFIWEAKLPRKILLFAPLVIILAVLPSFLGYGLFGSTYWLPWLDAQKLSEFREAGTSIGNTAADISLDFSNPISFIWTYSQSYFNVFLGPFPWQWNSPKLFMAVPETIIVWVIAFKSATKLFNHKSTRLRLKSANFLLIISCFLIATIALFNDNFGTTSRIRHFAWSLMIIYFSIIWVANKNRTHQVKQEF